MGWEHPLRRQLAQIFNPPFGGFLRKFPSDRSFGGFYVCAIDIMTKLDYPSPVNGVSHVNGRCSQTRLEACCLFFFRVLYYHSTHAPSGKVHSRKEYLAGDGVGWRGVREVGKVYVPPL